LDPSHPGGGAIGINDYFHAVHDAALHHFEQLVHDIFHDNYYGPASNDDHRCPYNDCPGYDAATYGRGDVH
jgi:hypothetical protein